MGVECSGVYKSTDGGASWSQINSGLMYTTIYSLAIDPVNTQTIYAGTNDFDGLFNIFKSTNGGANWGQFNFGLPTDTGPYSLSIDPNDTQTVYAGTYGNGVFKSTDGGGPFMTVPGAPTGVTAKAGNAQAAVSFTPASNGGTAITSYTVTSSAPSITKTGPSSPIAVTGLINGTAYTFTVKATNAVGTGPASSPSNSVTPATVPGAPTAVTAKAGDAQATVSFTPPASNGGSAITGYTVNSKPGGITNTGPTSPITVTGLANGTSYTFTVTATNVVGTGPASKISNSVTPKIPPSITVTSPKGGETWHLGKTYTISWNYTGNPGTTVMIELVGGSASSVIKASKSIGANGKGSYSWIIPKEQASGSDYKVRITSTTKPSCTATSNGTFTIN